MLVKSIHNLILTILTNLRVVELEARRNAIMKYTDDPDREYQIIEDTIRALESYKRNTRL